VHITSLNLTDYRNIASWAIEPHKALTVLLGPNAAGKTNTIEAIQVVCTGASFRRPAWNELVRWGSPGTTITLEASGETPAVSTTLTIHDNGQRAWKVGGVRKRSATDATRFVPIIMFTPDDLGMIKGPAEQRRSNLDVLGEQLSVVYGALRRDYMRVVRQRNALLRDEVTPATLEPWNLQLVHLGARLHTHRRRLLGRLAEQMETIYEGLSGGETLGVTMIDRCGIGSKSLADEVSQEEVAEGLARELIRRTQDEYQRRVTLVGPHRDDVTFSIEGANARAFASQGQQRTIALAWKLAEVSVVRTVLSRTPVLLLDDVMSELDEDRRAALTGLIQQDIQTFVTTTNTTYFDPDLLQEAMVVHVGEQR